MKILGAGIALVLVVLLALYLLWGRGRSPRSLRGDEEIVRGLVREVYGEEIMSESINIRESDAIFTITLRDEKLQSLEISLSSLAR